MFDWWTMQFSLVVLPFAGAAVAVVYRDIRDHFKEKSQRRVDATIRSEDRVEAAAIRRDTAHDARAMKHLEFEVAITRDRIAEQKEIRRQILALFESIYEALREQTDPTLSTVRKALGIVTPDKLPDEITRLATLGSSFGHPDMSSVTTATSGQLWTIMAESRNATTNPERMDLNGRLFSMRMRFHRDVSAVPTVALQPLQELAPQQSPALPETSES